MTHNQLKQYFLNVGRSYYSSNEFASSILRATGGKRVDFLPISRFGIGLVSSFIVSDRVEVYTRSLNIDGSHGEELRLTLDGLDRSFVLRREKQIELLRSEDNSRSLGMPSPLDSNSDVENSSLYAQQAHAPYITSKPGTSIAVAIRGSSEVIGFNTENSVSKYLVSPPVSIDVNSTRVGFAYTRTIETPWTTRTTHPSPQSWISCLKEELGLEVESPFKIEIIPFDFTKHSPSGQFGGQSCCISLDVTDEWLEFEESFRQIGMITINRVQPSNAQGELFDGLLYWTIDLSIPLNIDTLSSSEVVQVSPNQVGSAVKSLMSDFFAARSHKNGLDHSKWQPIVANKRQYLKKTVRLPPVSLRSLVSDFAFDVINEISKRPLEIISHNGIVVPPAWLRDQSSADPCTTN